MLTVHSVYWTFIMEKWALPTYWATRARVLQLLARHDEARAAYQMAAGLTEDYAVRSFLLTAAKPSALVASSGRVVHERPPLALSRLPRLNATLCLHRVTSGNHWTSSTLLRENQTS